MSVELFKVRVSQNLKHFQWMHLGRRPVTRCVASQCECKGAPAWVSLQCIKHTVHWLYCSGCWFHLSSAYLHITTTSTSMLNIFNLHRNRDVNCGRQLACLGSSASRSMLVCGSLWFTMSIGVTHSGEESHFRCKQSLRRSKETQENLEELEAEWLFVSLDTGILIVISSCNSLLGSRINSA